MTESGPNEAVQYAARIKPLFRVHDRESMRFMFDLWSYRDVRAHADHILIRLQQWSMPSDGAWPREEVELSHRWIEGGKQPLKWWTG
jgi:hypothetical protein